MHQLPLFLDIKDRRVLVVGGSELAARRVEVALDAGARVRAVAESGCPAFEDAVQRDGVEPLARDFDPGDLDGCVLVFVATDDDALNARVSGAARDVGIPVTVADTLELSTFTMPSIVDRSPVVVAVNTGGEAPIFSRLLRAKLESFIPTGFGRLAALAGQWRERVKAVLPDQVARRRFWEDYADGAIAEHVLAGRMEAAEKLLARSLDDAGRNADARPQGEVYLVGSGPGDPDLLTFRALRLMQKADVVLHDRLVTDDVLRLARFDAERLFVGKKRGEHALPQDEISRLMVDLAKQGKRVLRLKGGDPFMFGRGGEEIETLAAEGIPFQVVPGVTAANGCASYAGIPLTHRDHAQSCLFVTGHMKDDTLDLDWESLMRPNQTLVVYMGLGALEELTGKLIAHGADPETPAAVVDNGTRIDQRVIAGTLLGLAAATADADLEGPAIVIVGTVVTLRDKLAWFSPADA